MAPQPSVGVADLGVKLMGAADDQAGGEVWGYRKLPLSLAPPKVGGQALEFGSQPSNAGFDPQLAFLRWTRATGWRYEQTPQDESGRALRGFLINERSARVTPSGGGLLLGADRRPDPDTPPASLPPSGPRPALSRVIVTLRNPGGSFRAIGPPSAGVLEPGEELAGAEGEGRVAVDAFDQGDRTGAYFGALGPESDQAVVRFDGETTWTREPIQLPDGAVEDGFRIVAISAAPSGGAWLLGRSGVGLGRGVMLFERSGTTWVERDLGSSPFASAETPALGIARVEPLGGSAQPLTATDDGVWVDGELQASDVGTPVSFTLFYDAGDHAVSGTWCDSRSPAGNAICDHPFGSRLTSFGYRSFAWAGEGYGGRVITNPLVPGDGAESNRGTYLRLADDRFLRMPGGGGNIRWTGAFSTPDEGWLEGPVHITADPEPARLREQDAWPVSARAPLMSVATQPGAPTGAISSQAVAVGLDGTVVRYEPGAGWTREFLLNSAGGVVRSALRGVAWPEADRGHAVGDVGAMWLWRRETGLWERDPGAPIGFEANLMDVAFSPTDPQRGYAVGKSGVILSYGKSWSLEPVPPGMEGRDLSSIAFAGNQALVVASAAGATVESDLLVNDGSGWRVDQQAHELLRSVDETPRLFTVSALPDGGAVAAGTNVVIERDGPGSPWRFADQPLPQSTVVAAAPFRDNGQVHAVVSMVPAGNYPPSDEIPPPDPNVPPPILPPFRSPGDGYVLRETTNGWRDEQHTAFLGSGPDRPVKSDPVLDFALSGGGEGWAVGGWSGELDSAGRGSPDQTDRRRAQTAGIYRYGGAATAAPGARTAGIPLPSGKVRFAVAGHAQCERQCADLAPQRLRPDVTLESVLSLVSTLHADPAGPRALLYTGGRLADDLPATSTGTEYARYAALLSSSPGLPVFPAVSATDAQAGIESFRSSFNSFTSPFGNGGAPAGIEPVFATPTGLPGARTHYAFDSTGNGGAVRVIVIDNSGGSLEASDPRQNPPEAQRPWLAAVLADARQRGRPAIVIGSRDLNSRFAPRLNVASDGDQTARMLIEGGASAYFFERPEENRTYRISAGGPDSIPAFGTGTLGYRSALSDPSNPTLADTQYGETGYLMAEIDVSRRDARTNRAPVGVRLIPAIGDLSMQAVDGTVLRRSRPALFQGLGRLPVSGDRWGELQSGRPSPPGTGPYVSLPADICQGPGCSSRVTPEYRFFSSDPDIGDFVRQDPQSSNQRKPLLGSNDKPIADAASGLFCAYNAGTTTVTVESGGLAHSQTVRVLGGAVQRPCGTVPLRPDRFRRAPSAGAATPPPAAGPGGSEPPVSFVPPPPPVAPSPEPKPSPRAQFFEAPPLAPDPSAFLPPTVVPVPPPAIRPSPPSGGMGRAYQYKREEELSPEEQSAFSRYDADQGDFPAGFVFGAIVLAALAGATIFAGPRARDRRVNAAMAGVRAYESNREIERSRQMSRWTSNRSLAIAALVISVCALVFSMTGVSSAVRKHLPGPSMKPKPYGLLRLSKGKKFPPACDPQGAPRAPRRPDRHPARARPARAVCAQHGRPRHLVPDERSLRPQQQRGRAQQLLLRDREVRRPGRLPADGRPADRRRVAGEAVLDHRRLAADGVDRPRPHRRPQGPPRDELLAHHGDGGLQRGRVAGSHRGLEGRPASGRARPGAAAGQPDAGHPPVRDRLRQPRQGRIRRLQAGQPARAVPLRLPQGSGRGRRGGGVMTRSKTPVNTIFSTLSPRLHFCGRAGA